MGKISCAVALAVLAFAFEMASAQQAVLQRGYDAGLSGANLTETTLTAANVKPATFGLVFTLPVDDKIYAQPLYVPHVAVAGLGTHNVVYVATMSDSLYAFDADAGGAPLWSINLATSVGALPVPIVDFTFAGNTNITGNVGILSTPVIDPATNIMYLVACTLEGGTMVYRLHAVNITNGAEPYPNTVISGSFGGLTFNAAHQNQRVSLTLAGNQVVFGFAAVEAESDDLGGYTGWMMAYNKQTLAQSGIFATVTTGTRGGGVWQSGRAPVVDASGYVYVFTGNGYQYGYDGVNDFSESVLKLNPASGLALVDWFTPSNWSSMDQEDLDLASSGPLLVPGTSPSLLAGGGKTGVLYVLNTANLGKYTATDSGVVQKDQISNSSLRGGPVYWQRSAANGGPLLYDWAANDWVKAYAFTGTAFGTAPSYQGSGSQIYPGGILTLSANGQLPGSGVLWATVALSGNVYNDAVDPGALYAFDADNVATELWSSTMNSSRDNFGYFAKFVPPLVANGKVYVATFSDQVAVYGLLAAGQASTPTFSPPGGTYSGAQSVAIADTTPGATIYYTTNGTAPTAGSAVYSAPIAVSATETLQAIAMASGYATSPVGSAAYTITPPAATPTFSPVAGTYTGAQSVTIADTTPGVTIYYTTNGTTPTTASAVYSAPVVVSTSETLQAIAVESGYATSAVGSSAYTINNSVVVVNDPTGFASAAGFNLVGASLTGGAFQLSNGGGQARAVWYGTPLNIQNFTSTFSFQITPAGPYIADGLTFTIQNAGANAVGSPGLGLGYQGIGSSVAVKFDLYDNSGEGVDSTGFYTNGATPTVPALDMSSSGVNLHSGDVLQATLSYNGTTLTLTLKDTVTNASYSASTAINIPATVGGNTAYVGFTAGTGGEFATQSILNWTYVNGGGTTPATATPTFSPGAGTYTTAQSVTIADATPGATIYYTTNGSTPTTGSAVYSTPIAVSASESLRAIAVANGYTASAVSSAAYTISSSGVAVNDPNGFASTAGFNLVGASLSGGALQLSNGGGQGHAVWFGTPLNVQNFTTTFNFQITPASPYIADGFTFTIQNAGANVVGATGGGLGYEGLGSSVAVKFDLYDNAGEGVDSTGFYTNGAMPTVPALDLSAAGVNLHSGDVLQATLSYNGTILTLTLKDTVTNASFSASTAIDIPTTVGGNSAYVGFTAGTGGESATQSILSWTYANGGATSAAATPTFVPGAGTYTSVQPVTIADATPGVTIYYTTNGSTPTTGSAVYSAPVVVSESETLQAIAVASGYTTSAVGSAAYTISTSGVVVNDPAGFASSAGLNLVGASLSGEALQLTNGGGQAHAVWYGTPLNVQNFTTTFAFQITPATPYDADGLTFTIQNAGANAVGSNGGGLGYAGIGFSVAVKFDLYNNAGEGVDSTGFYTDGAMPTVPTLDMTASHVNLHSGDVLQATLTYDGTTLTLTLKDTETNASFSASTAIDIPTTVGGDTAYVGFTAGTGGEFATQEILNWTYQN